MYKQLKRKLKVLTSRDGCEVFNVGRATQWAFADGLGDNLKDDPDPETIGLAVLILRQVVSHHFAKIPPEVLLTGNLEGIAPDPRLILHAPSALSVHGGLKSAVSLGPGPFRLKSDAQSSGLPLL